MHNLFIIYILHTSSSSEELFLLSTVFFVGQIEWLLAKWVGEGGSAGRMMAVRKRRMRAE